MKNKPIKTYTFSQVLKELNVPDLTEGKLYEICATGGLLKKTGERKYAITSKAREENLIFGVRVYHYGESHIRAMITRKGYWYIRNLVAKDPRFLVPPENQFNLNLRTK
jgi:hypothetical protein